MTQNNPFDLPVDIRNLYIEVEGRFNKFLQEGKLRNAQEMWMEVYEIILKAQEELGKRLHKGGILHNLGLIAVLSNDLSEGFKNFVLAFAEDVISQEEWEQTGSAEGGPAAKNLIGFYKVPPELLQQFRKITVDSFKKGEYWDPRRIFKPLLETQFKNVEVQKQVGFLKEHPFEDKERHSINRIPGEWHKRVFIGGDYNKEKVGSLYQIKLIVEKKGYTPIMAKHFKDVEQPPIHHHSLLLLHNCKYAIFDVGSASGYLMEVERTLDYETEALLVYKDKPQIHITEMVRSVRRVYPPKPFNDFGQLEGLINNFLP